MRFLLKLILLVLLLPLIWIAFELGASNAGDTAIQFLEFTFVIPTKFFPIMGYLAIVLTLFSFFWVMLNRFKLIELNRKIKQQQKELDALRAVNKQ